MRFLLYATLLRSQTGLTPSLSNDAQLRHKTTIIRALKKKRKKKISAFELITRALSISVLLKIIVVALTGNFNHKKMRTKKFELADDRKTEMDICNGEKKKTVKLDGSGR